MRPLPPPLRPSPQDISRLVDVCRQTIVFQHPAALVECVRAVRTDPDVRVVRAKNRLDPAFNSAQSAGWARALASGCQ